MRRGLWRQALVVGLSIPLFMWVASLPPLPQALAYHDFADQRTLAGLPHFWNVVSNVPFAVVGLLGCWWLVRAERTSIAFEQPGERIAYFVFFAGEFLTCFGSGYYHANPTNQTLIWDRVVFSLMLTSIFVIIVTEFVNQRLGKAILVPTAALGLFSVLYWGWTESIGAGDVRLYAVVQFYPVIAIPVILLLFRSRYTHAGVFWLAWTLYAVAKAAEVSDAAILQWTGFWSGHTVKHLIAAGASYALLYALQHRARASAVSGATSTRVWWARRNLLQARHWI